MSSSAIKKRTGVFQVDETAEEGRKLRKWYRLVQRLKPHITGSQSLDFWPGIVCDQEMTAFLLCGKVIPRDAQQAYDYPGNFLTAKIKPSAKPVPVYLIGIRQAFWVPSNLLVPPDKRAAEIILRDLSKPERFRLAYAHLIKNHPLSYWKDEMKQTAGPDPCNNRPSSRGKTSNKTVLGSTSSSQTYLEETMADQFASDEEVSNGSSPDVASHASMEDSRTTPSTQEESEESEAEHPLPSTLQQLELSASSNPPKPENLPEAKIDLGHSPFSRKPATTKPATAKPANAKTGNAKTGNTKIAVAEPAIAKSEGAKSRAAESKISTEETSVIDNSSTNDPGQVAEPTLANTPEPEKANKLRYGIPTVEERVLERKKRAQRRCNDDEVRVIVKDGEEFIVKRKTLEQSSYLKSKIEEDEDRGEDVLSSLRLQKLTGDDFQGVADFLAKDDFFPRLLKTSEGKKLQSFDCSDTLACMRLSNLCIKLAKLAADFELGRLSDLAIEKFKIAGGSSPENFTDFLQALGKSGFNKDAELITWCAQYTADHFYEIGEKDTKLVRVMHSLPEFSKQVFRLLAGLNIIVPRSVKRSRKSRKSDSSSSQAATTGNSSKKTDKDSSVKASDAAPESDDGSTTKTNGKNPKKRASPSKGDTKAKKVAKT